VSLNPSSERRQPICRLENPVDFVGFDEAWKSLAPLNVIRLDASTDEVFRPGLEDSDELVIFDLCGTTPDADAIPLQIPRERAADALEALIHKLHLAPLLLFPVGRWRSVFDAITFELAENEAWQEIESSSIVALNTHDPLMCEPGDLHLVHDIFATVLDKGTTPEQGMTLAALGKPLVICAEPPDQLRIELGRESLAAEVRELLEPFSTGST
jgi:hypothetical protein